MEKTTTGNCVCSLRFWCHDMFDATSFDMIKNFSILKRSHCMWIYIVNVQRKTIFEWQNNHCKQKSLKIPEITCSSRTLKISHLSFLYYFGFSALKDYFIHFKPSKMGSWDKTCSVKTPRMWLSNMCPERDSNLVMRD